MNKLFVYEESQIGAQGYQGQWGASHLQIDELDPAEWHLILQLRQIKTPSFVKIEVGGDGKPKAVGEIIEGKRQVLAKELPIEQKPIM